MEDLHEIFTIIGIEDGLSTVPLPHHPGVRVRTGRFMKSCQRVDAGSRG